MQHSREAACFKDHASVRPPPISTYGVAWLHRCPPTTCRSPASWRACNSEAGRVWHQRNRRKCSEGKELGGRPPSGSHAGWCGVEGSHRHRPAVPGKNISVLWCSWLAYLPVTQEIAGSSPAKTAHRPVVPRPGTAISLIGDANEVRRRPRRVGDDRIRHDGLRPQGRRVGWTTFSRSTLTSPAKLRVSPSA
jgi:hypothetical protein